MEHLLDKDALDALRGRTGFSDHEEARRIFDIDSRGTTRGFTKASSGKFAIRLKGMLERTGFKVTSSAQQVKGASRVYTLKFDAHRQHCMAQLVKLATADCRCAAAEHWSVPQVYTYLQKLELCRYKKYMKV